jgi:6-hydroxynicotinate 3-monooxygenase
MRIAVIGAGLGGTTLAAMLAKAGHQVTVYEQASALTPIGAGIHLGPNLMAVMRSLGIEHALVRAGNLPDAWVSRDAQSAETLFRLPFDEARYGAPYVTIHRGIFHELLIDTVPAESFALDKRLVELNETAGGIELCFADETRATADIVVGADGVNSRVRELLLGSERPRYTGNVCYRAHFPTTALGSDVRLDDVTKWWGDHHRSVMVYFMNDRRDMVYFVADVPQTEWTPERSWVDGDVAELRAAFEDCHPRLRQIVGAADEATKWAMFERDPLPLWSRDRIVLLGDACHPMRPHMGQGAAMAIEDGAVLARCLIADGNDYRHAFTSYEASRHERASAVQTESSRNRWLRAETDPSWVYHYDAATVPLAG